MNGDPMSPRDGGEDCDVGAGAAAVAGLDEAISDSDTVGAADAVAAEDEPDEETQELAKLRCPSLCTEDIVSRERQRQERRTNRCSDYPGLAFGSPMFGSDTMMKFNIIKNELHNIMKSQLKRVEGEVNALAQRIKALDDNLERSGHFIKASTGVLAEAVQWELDNRKDPVAEEEEESVLYQFDVQMKLLEGKLMQARSLVLEATEIEAGNAIGHAQPERK